MAVLLWKASPRFPEPLSGIGDTDLLVAAKQHDQAVEVLAKCGFRQVSGARWRSQAFVGDWFRVDASIGALVHVQLYEKLILGSAFDPQVEVPNAGDLFERTGDGFPPGPSMADAAVLRVCRAALRRPWTPGRSADLLLSEAMDLAEGLDSSEMANAASLFPPDTAKAILNVFSGGRHAPLRRRLLGEHRSLPKAGGERPAFRLLAGLALWNRATLRLPIFCRRQLPRPAPVIAVIGSDGSGKSTVAREVSRTLHEKFDTRFVYFGTGDGPASWYRKPLVSLRKLRSRREVPADGNVSKADAPRQEIPASAKALWAVTVALERKGKMKRARRAAAAGWIVVTDRYPQVEFPGIHDGPRLGQWLEESGIRGRLARWENRIYHDLSGQRPDLVLLLAVSPEEAQRRRPEESAEELARRIEIAAKLRFGGCPRVVVDADRPLDKMIGIALENAFASLHEH
ncbi:MAG: hypothetical protein WD342_12535 [Verrucomicrobiales bacterium]